MSLPVKTRKPFVFVDTYRCFNMSIVTLIFYMGEDLFSQAFDFAVFFFHLITKNAKLSTNKVSAG